MEWLFAALLGGYLTFNAVVTPDKAAKLAESSLQKKFPNSIVHVEMEGKKGKAVLNGKFKKVRIEIRNLTVDDLPFEASDSGASVAGGGQGQEQKKAIGGAQTFEIALENVILDKKKVDKVNVSFQDLRYDLNALKNESKLKFISYGPSQLNIQISPTSLVPLFSEKMADVSNLVVTTEDGIVKANGQREVFGLPASFEFRATPGFSGSQLLFENQKLIISGVPVPELIAKPIIGNINPVYVFDKHGTWPFFPRITKAVADSDGLEIEAALTQKTVPATVIESPTRAN